MKLARYVGEGRIEIREEAAPVCPKGGLLVQTLASGLCSGELMQWYMDKKIPHVLGHEVCGRIVESGDPGFPVGAKVFVHHHAPCLHCEFCADGRYVHCSTWRRTRLDPGGMAETFAVAKENLTDTFLVEGLRPVDAALIEPLACVAKSLRVSGWRAGESAAVIGLGPMGLMHLLALGAVGGGFELREDRAAWAKKVGGSLGDPEKRYRHVFVCPGSSSAIDFGIRLAEPGGSVVLFAPLDPGESPSFDLNAAYFKDVRLVGCYSCGPDDTREAARWLREGKICAEQVVSDFLSIEELPKAYQRMRDQEILKAMAIFDEEAWRG